MWELIWLRNIQLENLKALWNKCWLEWELWCCTGKSGANWKDFCSKRNFWQTRKRKLFLATKEFTEKSLLPCTFCTAARSRASLPFRFRRHLNLLCHCPFNTSEQSKKNFLSNTSQFYDQKPFFSASTTNSTQQAPFT